MLKKSFISSLYVIPATLAVILFATHLWTPNYLITPPQLSGFESQIEGSVVILFIALYSFILPNRFEIELCLVNGYSTLKLALSKALPIFLYSTATALISVAFFKYKPFIDTQLKTLIPIYVPDNFRVYTFISIFVTVLFFSSFYFLVRVLTRNCYLPVIADLLVFTSLSSISEGIKKGITDIRVSLIDPFITTYFVGNTIPNNYAEKYRDLTIMKNAWTVNRIIFLALSFVFLMVTVFLLHREKLHRGLGE